MNEYIPISTNPAVKIMLHPLITHFPIKFHQLLFVTLIPLFHHHWFDAMLPIYQNVFHRQFLRHLFIQTGRIIAHIIIVKSFIRLMQGSNLETS